MARVPAELREHILAFWRGHSEAWKLSGVTQREYCEEHSISLKSFGNWRAQLKRIALAGHHARWGHYPRLRKVPEILSHMANHVAKRGLSPRVNPRAKTVPNPRAKAPVLVAAKPSCGRRQFSDDAKRHIVAETCRPGASASDIARRYGLDLRLLRRWRKAFGSALSVSRISGGRP